MAGNYLNSKRQTFVVPEELKSRQHDITHYICQQIFAPFFIILFILPGTCHCIDFPLLYRSFRRLLVCVYIVRLLDVTSTFYTY